MKIIDNFISLNIQKLFLSGRIDKAYRKMYELAEELAIHETELYKSLTGSKLIRKVNNSKDFDLMSNLLEKVVAYRQKRLQHHINEMKDLLKLREEVLKGKIESSNGQRKVLEKR